jgi:CIC family chloride channel protein
MKKKPEAAIPKDLKEAGQLNLAWMILCSVLVGVVAGFGAVLFRMMIGFVHNLFFYGSLDFHYNANIHMAECSWGWAVIFVPFVGALFVTWLVENFAPEAKGHGVPEVMDAIYNKGGKIRPAVAIVKSLASAISIGTGGSVGREGPIAQIGAAFGSTLGQLIHMPVRQRVILIAAGASAGIAATFNAPIGGLAFAIELMLVSISASTVSIVVFSTVIATYIGRLFLGLYPAFNISALMTPHWHLLSTLVLALFVPFGILCGVASTALIKAIYWAEDFFEALPVNAYVRHMSGMLLLGVIMYLFFRFSGHYYVNGVGYSTIVDVLRNVLSNPWFLLLLFVGKLAVTSLTLGSGASGGVFSPSLFLGATMGSAFAGVVNHFVPGADLSQPMFAIAGMAALVGGSTGAVLTAIVMTCELTGDYSNVLPIMVTVVLSYGVRTIMSKESIYTLKLLRRGVTVPSGLQASLIATRTACNAMSSKFKIIKQADLLSGAVDLTEEQDYVVIEDDAGEIVGLLRVNYLVMGIQPTEQNLARLIDSNFLVAKPHQKWLKILRAINQHKYKVIFVSKVVGSKLAKDLVGVITTNEVVQASSGAAKLMQH